MTGIDVDEHRTDRGKHLVDLLADGLGQDRATEPLSPADDAQMRSIFVLGGVSIALLFTAVTALLLS